MKIKSLIVGLLCAASIFSTDSYGKGGSSGGFSSSRSSGGFSSSRSSSVSSPSRSSFSSSKSSTPSVSKPSPSVSKPSAVSTPAKGSFSSSSSKVTTSKPVVSAPKTAFDKSQAIRSITPPKPKEQYIADFKVKNAAKYPTTFSTQPAQRPTYIPPTTVYNGQSMPIQYNQQAGGYGFFDGLGKFIIYDAILDVAKGAFNKDQTEYTRKVEEIKNTPTEKGTNWGGVFLCLLVMGSLVGLFFYVRKLERY